jgi:hypothetical protein
MIANGEPVEKVVKYSGLTIEEIAEMSAHIKLITA